MAGEIASVTTMDEYTLDQITHYRRHAQALGDAALDAMSRGDIGLARSASRQAAQYARIVMQLESGEKQVAPPDPEPKSVESEGGSEISPVSV